MTALADRPLPAAEVLGSTTPRLWTRPRVTGPPGPCGCGCALTPATSLGFEAVAFAEQVLEVALRPWQRWLLIHAFELLPGSSPAEPLLRFRTLLILVARQNGKTQILKVIALWLMYRGRAELILGAAQTLEIAKEAWEGAVRMAQRDPELAAYIAGGRPRRTNGDVTLELVTGPRYKITAATEEAGRGLSVDLLILDELRAQRDMRAWAALSKTTSARENGLIIGISNAGSDASVVLNTLRDTALAEVEDSVGIMEWSAPDGCDLDDPAAWAAANPSLGRGLHPASIRASLATDPPAVFRTEVLCQRVTSLDGAIDPQAWAACADRSGSLAAVAPRVALCLDVAEDGAHVTLVGAALLDDSRVRIGMAGAWSSIDEARQALPDLIEAIDPAQFGWFPGGPAAALGADLRTLRLRTRRAFAKIVEREGRRQVVDTDEEELSRLSAGLEKEACQGLAADVLARRVIHPDDPLLNAHVAAAVKVRTGDSWRFGRLGGAGHVDAAYAAAGAVYLARLTPPAAPLPRSAVF